MDKIKLGLIGCGDIAFRSYLPAIRQMEDRVELAATCSRTRERAEQARQEYGGRHAFTSADDMLAAADLDAVVILTPMPSHGPLALAALEAGKHVYVEKVIAVQMAEARRMVDLAGQKNLVLACAPSTILLSAYQHLKELVQAGQIGRVCFAQALGAHGGPARWDGFTGDPAWFYQPGGGPLLDLAVYPIHILTQLLGPVARVTAFSGLAVPEILVEAQQLRGQTIKVEVDDTTLALLDFGNATLAMVGASYNMLSSRLPEMQIWGSEGALTAPQFMGDEVGIWQRSSPEWKLQHLPATTYDRLGLGAGLSHWLDCIRAGTEPVNNGRHGLHVLDVLLSIQTSARKGAAVELATSF